MSCARRPRTWSGTRWAKMAEGGIGDESGAGGCATADCRRRCRAGRRHGRRARGLPRGRPVVGRRAPACRRRPASGEGLVLRPPRPDAAALRHRRDARPPCRAGRGLRPKTVVALGDSFHDDDGAHRLSPPTVRRWPRSSPAATGSGSPAITIRLPRRSPACASTHSASARSPSATSPPPVRPMARSPAISIPPPASSAAAGRSAAAASPAMATG